MSALGLASLGVYCEDRPLGMSSLGVFCDGIIEPPIEPPVGGYTPAWTLGATRLAIVSEIPLGFRSLTEIRAYAPEPGALSVLSSSQFGFSSVSEWRGWQPTPGSIRYVSKAGFGFRQASGFEIVPGVPAPAPVNGEYISEIGFGFRSETEFAYAAPVPYSLRVEGRLGFGFGNMTTIAGVRGVPVLDPDEDDVEALILAWTLLRRDD